MSGPRPRQPATAVWLVAGDPSTELAERLPSITGDPAGTGATGIALGDLPDRPFDLAARRFIAAVDLAADDSGAVVVGAAARGVDIVLRLASDHPRRTALLDELARVAELHDLTRPTASRLPPDLGALVAALAEGDSVAVAARRVGMSRRTAYRRLEEVGAALGTSTVRATVEAARAAGLLPDGITDRRR